MSKRKLSAEEKITAVNLYLNGKGSQRQIAVSYGISQASEYSCAMECVKKSL